VLTVEGLCHSYVTSRRGPASADPPPRAVDNVSFEVREGDMFTLLGPSGCGKTTTLRSIAGLEYPQAGRITLDGRVIYSQGMGPSVKIPANQRGLGMVFQSYAIWPHMKVVDNVAFPLEARRGRQRLSRKDIRAKVMAVLETVGLAEYAQRQATDLSGGQQQRLALARAIVDEPSLLLLDEPLSNLDARLRESLRFELKRLQVELGITSLYVTHDQSEALGLSTVIAVMNKGQILQVGAPIEVYENPNCMFVAQFIGTTNMVTGHVIARDGGSAKVDTVYGSLTVADGSTVGTGETIAVSVRPEAIRMHGVADLAGNGQGWKGKVTSRVFLGDCCDFLVQVDDLSLRVRADASAPFVEGDEVVLDIDAKRVRIVPQ
jgi:iron(III) transport system ATP-binding protein